jgi:hypothetical protein
VAKELKQVVHRRKSIEELDFSVAEDLSYPPEPLPILLPGKDQIFVTGATRDARSFPSFSTPFGSGATP